MEVLFEAKASNTIQSSIKIATTGTIEKTLTPDGGCPSGKTLGIIGGKTPTTLTPFFTRIYNEMLTTYLNCWHAFILFLKMQDKIFSNTSSLPKTFRKRGFYLKNGICKYFDDQNVCIQAFCSKYHCVIFPEWLSTYLTI